MDELSHIRRDSQCHGRGYISSLSLCLVAVTIRTLRKDSKFWNRKRKNKAERSSPVAEPATLALLMRVPVSCSNKSTDLVIGVTSPFDATLFSPS